MALTARLVEAPTKMWHLRNAGEATTLCGEDAGEWPVVLHWDVRSGVTCGRCLFASGAIPFLGGD